MPDRALAVLVPVGLIAVCLGVFLLWVRLGTKEPLKHDNTMPETYFRESD
ncbi:hypothetical protein [Streptomyces sp. NBC_01012]|nr:SKG-like transmembrane protein [Streptomyces sp. NBC_01012]